jgi:hypothetical protein
MNKDHDYYTNHEIRITVAEEISKDTREILRHMDNKLDSQFKWIIGIIATMFGGIILHLAKLI